MLHLDRVDPCDYLKCGQLERIISGSGGLRSRPPPQKGHVLAPRMVDVSMIDALLCFLVGRAGRWRTGHHEQGRNESGGEAKDLQPQKVSVLGFTLKPVVN